jgi:hypothetical protein
MSHIVTIQTEVRDQTAVNEACRRLHLPTPVLGEHRVFSQKVHGLGVSLPEWKYPVVCDLRLGTLHYDNYEGAWGNPKELDRFKQAYAVEKTKLEARRHGRSVAEHLLEDGTVQLTIDMEAR